MGELEKDAQRPLTGSLRLMVSVQGKTSLEEGCLSKAGVLPRRMSSRMSRRLLAGGEVGWLAQARACPPWLSKQEQPTKSQGSSTGE